MNRLRFTRLAVTVVLVSMTCLIVDSVPTAASATITRIDPGNHSLLLRTELPDWVSQAEAVSGNIVVGYAGFSPGGSYAFAYDLSTSTMTDLGTLPGYTTSIATGISGNIVIGEAVSLADNYEAFAYDLSTDTMTDLGTLPGGTQSLPEGISGNVVVGISDNAAGDVSPFSYDLSTSGPITALGNLPGYTGGAVVGISGNTVVGYSADFSGGAPAGVQAGFVYNLSTSTMISLGSWVVPAAIDGNTVVGNDYSIPSHHVAFAYDLSTDTMTDLGTALGAGAISGNTVVGVDSSAPSSPVVFAYDLSTDAMTDLGTLGGSTSSFGPSFSGGGRPIDGNIVVGESETAAGASHAFAYDLSTDAMTDLGTLGGTTSSADAVSGNIVVGTADTANGFPHAFAYDLSTSTMTDLGTCMIVNDSLPDGSVGVPYSATLTASGGSLGTSSGALTASLLAAPRHANGQALAKSVRSLNKWTKVSGSLPRGVHLTKKGLITGRPRRSGTFKFTVQVVNLEHETNTRLLSITVKS